MNRRPTFSIERIGRWRRALVLVVTGVLAAGLLSGLLSSANSWAASPPGTP